MCIKSDRYGSGNHLSEDDGDYDVANAQYVGDVAFVVIIKECKLQLFIVELIERIVWNVLEYAGFGVTLT